MTAPAASDVVVRHRIRVAGVVQGVGFRPFVHRLATELDLAGSVGNDPQGVFVEVEGPAPALDCFEARLVDEAPSLARIYEVEVAAVATLGDTAFRIVESQAGGGARTLVAPDVSVCDDCLAELADPGDRRYRYPFINCTNCGPRFTITVRLPYDRPNTTMGDFALCSPCAEEYHDPTDRRFHAQPVACAQCGPRLRFEDGSGPVEGNDAALAGAQAALGRGLIVAIKGLGGYHLACDAFCDAAVGVLRQRKGRPHKPLAVMVPDLAVAHQLAFLDATEAALLSGPERPIVLVRRREERLSRLVAPANPLLGVLLPYTPLHHLLFQSVPDSRVPVPRVLVMTSGNLSDEPICYEDDDARRRLGAIADAWLVHDRPIHVPCDDSVLRVAGGQELPIRRSRGYAPLPVRLPFSSVSLLATGGELKNTFCLASGREAWVSQHVGDMGSLETLSAFERSTRQFAELYQVERSRMAADGHPGYQTRRWAERQAEGQLQLVQHHHAHIAAVMVEHQVPVGHRVIGFAFDGTGYGTDGAIWGGEVLVATYDRFERVAHLRYVPLPGGDSAIRKPYRVALSHLWAAGIDWSPDLWPVQAAPAGELALIKGLLERDVHCVATSSMGRLFDAVSSLLGIRHIASYEGQAAIELEQVAAGCSEVRGRYRFGLTGDQIDAAPVLQGMIDDLRHGVPQGHIAAGFHRAVAHLIAETADRLRYQTGINSVALSGGVFQNVLLLRLVSDELTRRHLRVLSHHLVPPNDGGLALGQAAIAGCRHSSGMPA